MAPRTIFRDSERQARFDADGYVRAPMLDTMQLSALMAEFAALRPHDGFAPDGNGFARNSYHCTFLDTDHAYKRATFDLFTRHFAHVLDRFLVDYRILTANFYIKPSGRGELPIHQNWPVLEDFAATSVTIWCPLVDVGVSNGTLHVVPGSHKLVPHVEGPDSPAYFTTFADRLYGHMTPLLAPAGEGFIFDDGLVHGSPPNLSETPRIAVQITCVPAELTPVFFFKESEARFELIEAEPEFYIEQGVGDLLTRKDWWRSRGHITSRNRQIGEAEFLSLLSRGDELRGQGDGMESTRITPPPMQPLFPWLPQRLRRLIPEALRRRVRNAAKARLRTARPPI